MNKKCLGCGIELQDNNVLIDGYTTSLDNDFCMRCFKLRNYGEYETALRTNLDYIEIIKNISKQKALILYVIDLLSIPKDLNKIKEYIGKNKIVLILNKKDVLPLSVSDEKIINYFKDMNLGFQDIILISTYKNYNLDKVYKVIKQNKETDKIYLVGNTNAGKSSLINKIIDNYTKDTPLITVSPMPSTTLNEITIKLKDFTLIDTPGIVESGNLLNYLDHKTIKKLTPHKEIKPKTYQLGVSESLIIGDFLRIDYINGDKNSFTLFLSNDIQVRKTRSKRNEKLKDLSSNEYILQYNEDIVINGIGFIKTTLTGKVIIYANKDAEIFTRKSLI